MVGISSLVRSDASRRRSYPRRHYTSFPAQADVFCFTETTLISAHRLRERLNRRIDILETSNRNSRSPTGEHNG